MQYNCYNIISIWEAAPPKPPAHESPPISVPLASKSSYASDMDIPPKPLRPLPCQIRELTWFFVQPYKYVVDMMFV